VAIVNPATIDMFTAAARATLAPLAKNLAATASSSASKLLPALRDFNFAKASKIFADNPKMAESLNQVMPRLKKLNDELEKNPTFKRLCSEVKNYMLENGISLLSGAHGKQDGAIEQHAPTKGNGTMWIDAGKAKANGYTLTSQQDTARDMTLLSLKHHSGAVIQMQQEGKLQPDGRYEHQAIYYPANGGQPRIGSAFSDKAGNLQLTPATGHMSARNDDSAAGRTQQSRPAVVEEIDDMPAPTRKQIAPAATSSPGRFA